jgi:drug/metabolite transporter (DMT)-like permease
VLVAGIGAPILGEAVSGTGLAGILLVFGGAWLLNIREFREGWHRPLTAPLRQRSARLMLLAASIHAFTGVFSRAPLAFLPPVFLGALYFTLVGITAWLGEPDLRRNLLAGGVMVAGRTRSAPKRAGGWRDGGRSRADRWPDGHGADALPAGRGIIAA